MRNRLFDSTHFPKTRRGIDSSGFASISVPLQKGVIYDVVRQETGNVVISVDGKNVFVQTCAVSLTEKPDTPAAGINGFVPCKIVIVSAKYSIDGNQPRTVKNNLQKLVPQSIVTEPVVNIVTDALSPAVQEQGIQTQGTVTVTGTNTANILMRTASKNVHTVECIFNGKRFTKQVPECAKFVLP